MSEVRSYLAGNTPAVHIALLAHGAEEYYANIARSAYTYDATKKAQQLEAAARACALSAILERLTFTPDDMQSYQARLAEYRVELSLRYAVDPAEQASE